MANLMQIEQGTNEFENVGENQPVERQMTEKWKMVAAVHRAVHVIAKSESGFNVTNVGITYPADGFTILEVTHAQEIHTFDERCSAVVSYIAPLMSEHQLLGVRMNGSAKELAEATEIIRRMVVEDGMMAEHLGYANHQGAMDDERRKKVCDVMENIRKECEEKAAILIRTKKHVIFALADKIIHAPRMVLNREALVLFFNNAHLIGPPTTHPETFPATAADLNLFYTSTEPTDQREQMQTNNVPNTTAHGEENLPNTNNGVEEFQVEG